MRSVLCALLVALCACERGSVRNLSEPAPATSTPVTDAGAPFSKRARRGGSDVTFLVTADTHFGVPGIERTHARIISVMNGIEGRAYPGALGGNVGKPRGVLIAGDLTENGRTDEWRSFRAHYGKSGSDGLLAFPAYEAVGNHDFWEVRRQVVIDRGALFHSWNWDDVHVICLGEAPDAAALKWLAGDLASIEPNLPIVVYMHFPLAGPYSDNWFGKSDHPERMRALLQEHNVLGIFHGHYHASGTYRWHGFDVYNVGSAKHDWKSFAAVRIDDARMRVAEWNYELGAWWWWHEKPINGASGHEKLGTRPRKKAEAAGPYVIGHRKPRTQESRPHAVTSKPLARLTP